MANLELIFDDSSSDDLSEEGCPGDEPNHDRAARLYAAGFKVKEIQVAANFKTLQDCRNYLQSAEGSQRVEYWTQEVVGKIGRRSLVGLHDLILQNDTDSRTKLAAIRTGLELTGRIGTKVAINSLQTKTVSELSVSELNELIRGTKQELDRRIAVNSPRPSPPIPQLPDASKK